MNTIEEKQVDVIEAYRGKWRNLYFLKDGRTFFATTQNFLWDTEAEAIAISKEFIAKSRLHDEKARQQGKRGVLNLKNTGGVKVYCHELTHAIPIPVKS